MLPNQKNKNGVDNKSIEDELNNLRGKNAEQAKLIQDQYDQLEVFNTSLYAIDDAFDEEKHKNAEQVAIILEQQAQIDELQRENEMLRDEIQRQQRLNQQVMAPVEPQPEIQQPAVPQNVEAQQPNDNLQQPAEHQNVEDQQLIPAVQQMPPILHPMPIIPAGHIIRDAQQYRHQPAPVQQPDGNVQYQQQFYIPMLQNAQQYPQLQFAPINPILQQPQQQPNMNNIQPPVQPQPGQQYQQPAFVIQSNINIIQQQPVSNISNVQMSQQQSQQASVVKSKSRCVIM